MPKQKQNKNTQYLEKKPAHPHTQQDIDLLHRGGIKPFQHQLFPEIEKSKGDSEQGGE